MQDALLQPDKAPSKRQRNRGHTNDTKNVRASQAQSRAKPAPLHPRAREEKILLNLTTLSPTEVDFFKVALEPGPVPDDYTKRAIGL